MLAPAFLLPAAVPAPQRPRFTVLAGTASARLPGTSLRDLIRIRLGEQLVREAYVEAWQPVIAEEVRRYARRGGSEDDLRGEGALALWEAALQYDPQVHRTSPERYIHNHVHRRIRTAYRESQGFDRPALVPLEWAPPQARPDEAFAASEQRADLHAAVNELRTVEREQFSHYMGLALSGMGPDEAARVVAARSGDSFAACKKRLERIRRRVRNRLQRP